MAYGRSFGGPSSRSLGRSGGGAPLSKNAKVAIGVGALGAVGVGAILLSRGASSSKGALPLAPTGLVVVTGSITTTGFSVKWSPQSDATSFIVYLNGKALAPPVTAPQDTFSGLVALTKYNVKVAGVNAAGTGPKSAVLTVKTA